MEEKNKRRSPPHSDIVDYWESRVDEGDIGIDWADSPERRCWRCAKLCKSKTANRIERCHIIPHSLKGSNEPCNFVLLCKHCHKEAPNINCKDAMWLWIKQTSVPYYNTWLEIRTNRDYKEIFGSCFNEDMLKVCKKKLGGLSCDEIKSFKLVLEDEYKKNLKEVSVHWGQTYFNYSTRAFLYHRVLEKLKRKRKTSFVVK
jgi:hypothetical protein